MSKLDKDYEVRMAGMINAYNIVKTQGIEALHAEIKRRGILKADIGMSTKHYQDWWNTVSKHIYNNMLVVTMYTLNDTFNFGKSRLEKFKADFYKHTNAVLDLDYMGDHYVTLEDYAVEMNEKYNLGLDAEICAVCTKTQDDESKYFHNTAPYEAVIGLLERNGFADSEEVKFLKNHLLEEKLKWQLENLENE